MLYDPRAGREAHGQVRAVLMRRLALGALWHNMGLLPEARIQPVLMHRLVLDAL